MLKNKRLNRRNSSLQPSRTIILVGVMILFVLFFVNFISAEVFTFDNVVDYSEDEMKANIINFFGIGNNTIGSAELKSHSTPTEIKNIIAGKDRAVMWYEFTDWKDVYTNGLGEVYFTDNVTGKRLDKEYYFAKQVLEPYEVEDYKDICEGEGNKTICSNILAGTHTEYKVKWEKLESNDIPKEKTVIGLITDVERRDKIDGVWTIAGKKIIKHAAWQDAWNTKLTAAWTFDVDYEDDTNYGINCSGNATRYDAAGIGGGFVAINGATKYLVCNGSSSAYPTRLKVTRNMTIRIIFNGSIGASNALFGSSGSIYQMPSANKIITMRLITGGAEWNQQDATKIFGATGVQQVIMNYNGSTACISINGTRVNCWGPKTGTLTWGTSTGDLFLGAIADGGNPIEDGAIFEVELWNRTLSATEESDLWNISSPISYPAISDATPFITLNSPVNNTNFSVQNVDFNCTGQDDDMIQNVSLYFNDALNYTKKNGITNYTELNITLILGDGNYNWTCRTYDNATVPQQGNGTYRFVSVDLQNPQVNITYPLDNVNYQKLNHNLTINWSVSDSSLSSCLGSYDNGINNFSVLCNDKNMTINITSLGNNSFMIWVNDSYGNSNISQKTWGYKVFQTETLFSSSTTEGGLENFKLNFTQGGGLQTSTINLIYNSTTYSSSYSISLDNVSSSNTITIPNKEFYMEIPFYWSITMSDGSLINTTIYNQTVNPIQIDDCSTYTNVIYNYTIYDEESKTKIANTTIEIQLQLYDSSHSSLILNFSKLYTETNPARVCFNGTLLTNINYSIDSVVKYDSNDTGISYAPEYYNILNQVLANSTVPRSIALYDLKSADSTDFQLTFKDENLAFAPNVLVYLYRQYIADNDFKIVEVPLTDSNGQTILHLVRNNVVYNIIMVDSNGNILATFNKIIAFCQDYTIGSCTISLNARSGADTVYEYLEDIGISYTIPTYSNSTKLVSFNFISTNLSARTVSTEIVKSNDFGNRSVCSNSLTSATGTLTCNVSSVTGTDRFLFVNIYVDGNLKAQNTIDLESSSSGFGIVNGAFFGFLMILFLVTMFMEDKQTLIVSLGIGWAVILALGLVSGTLIGALSGGIWLIVTIIIFLWKLKKEEMG